MEEKKLIKTSLTHAADLFLPLMEDQIKGNGIKLSDYAKQCAYSTMIALNRLVTDNSLSWSDFDTSNVVDVLMTVAGWELNPNATPREVYFQLRNKKIKKRDPATGRTIEGWQKIIEAGIEGDGNDAILSRFGRNVATVHRFWIIKEHDEFVYPYRDGLKITPPKWIPKGDGKCVRLVYPITFKDGTTEYYICERQEVFGNLLAHISNNMMNETFGVCQDRYKATESQKKEIAAKKKEYITKATEMGFDVLDSEEFEPWISSAWRSEYSREQMIIRKMRNNIVKKIPKDFSIPQGAISFAESEGEKYCPPDTIEVDFAEEDVTQSDDEQLQLQALNEELQK